MSKREPTSRVYLLRHARAGWAEPGQRDFDRKLDEQGRSDADRMGLAMAINGFSPKVVICSNATRCLETLGLIAPRLSAAQTVYTDALYAGDHLGYLDIIREYDGIASVMLVGHNPMMENTAEALLPNPDKREAETLRFGFPTASLAVIDVAGGLSGAGQAKAKLTGFLTPRDV